MGQQRKYRKMADKKALEKYMNLDCHGRVQAMYVWVDGTGENLRSKTRTLMKAPKDVSELPEWNYDGSSTGQAEGRNSDCYLRPVRIFPDPFRGKPHILVLSEVLKSDKTPADTNHRYSCAKVMDKVKAENPGSAWNKNGQCLTKTDILTDGLNRVIQVPRDLITVLWAAIMFMAVTSLRLTIAPAFTPVFKFRAQTLR